jgi:glycosyltransferase involved in cell wall biosynthesis
MGNDVTSIGARRGAAHSPLRIALYSPELPDSGAVNGIVTYSRIMRDALRALGHSVTVVSADQIERADGRVAEIPTPSGIAARLRTLLEARRRKDGSDPWIRLRIMDAFKAARRAGVEVFEIEESFGWAGRLVGQGVAIVERLHGPHVYGRDDAETAEQRRLGDLREEAELASFSRVQAITCPSQRLLSAMVERYRIKAPINRAIPNPIPVAQPDSLWSSGFADPDQILCVGRFDLRKGADVAIRAFDLALKRRPSLRLVMAGPDRGLMQPNGSVTHFEEFVATEIRPETRARIRFLGPQRPDRIAELRRQSGLALVASRFENFAYSIAEAMAVGMPVLASDSFGNGEMIRDGLDGRIVPIAHVGAMADAMVAMAGDPGRLAEMGRSAYERVSQWLSPERIALETVEVYREALTQLGRPTS